MMLTNNDQVPQPLATLPEQVILEVRQDGIPVRRLEMEHSELLVGRGGCCDLRFEEDNLPVVHSEFRRQGDVLWIETVDADQKLTINNKAYQRLALRNGDRVQIGNHEILVHIGLAGLIAEAPDQDVESDLSSLSADELCDRILAEQQQISEFEDRQLRGWHDLISALDYVLTDSDPSPVIPSPISSSMLTELQRIEQTLKARRLQEAAESGEDTEASSDVRFQRLDELLQQLQDSDLRVSA